MRRTTLSISRLLFTAVIFASLLTAALTSCATQSKLTEEELLVIDQSRYIPQEITWKEVSPGFERFDYENKDFPVEYHLVKIDLKTKGMTISAYPDPLMEQELKQAQSEADGFFKGISTSSFARQFKTTVAVNTTPFKVVEGTQVIAYMKNKRAFHGIHKTEGVQLSEEQPSNAMLVFSKENGSLKAEIYDSQKKEIVDKYPYAFGGFYTIMRNGEKRTFKADNLDSRLACGVSKDGYTLYFLAAEGSPSLTSKGLSFPQCADVLLKAGAVDAMQFDGGSSTQLCIGTKQLVTANPSIAVAASIGFSVKQQ